MPKRKTKEEREWIERVVALGCIICQAPGEYHHMLKGAGMGQKSSHFDGFCLCPFHHRNGWSGEAIHAGIKSWEAIHGTEQEHLEKTRELLNA